VIVPCNILSDEKMYLSSTIAAGLHQRSHSQVPRPAELMTTFYCLRAQIPQNLEGQEQGGLVIPPNIRFPFVSSYDSQGYGGGFRNIDMIRPSCIYASMIWYPEPRL
jgi:hypothetical protein